MLMKTLKNKCLWGLLIFITWIFIPPTLFYGDFNKIYSTMSPDNKYKLVAYKLTLATALASAYGFYKAIHGEIYFLILYDANNNIIFRPSLYQLYSFNVIAEATFFQYDGKDKSLWFPSRRGFGYESYQLEPCRGCEEEDTQYQPYENKPK